jgi:hypothetical protein
VIADVRAPLQQRIVGGDAGVVARTTLDVRQTVGGYRATTVQAINLGANSQATANTFGANLALVPEIYFDLQIGVDSSSGWQSVAGQPPHLAPGAQYLLRVASTGIADPSAGLEPIRLVRGLNLSVGGPGEVVSANGAAHRSPLRLPADLVSVDPDTAVASGGFVHDFPLEVAEDAEVGNLVLELRATDGFARPKTVASLEVYIDGRRNALAVGQLQAVRIGALPPPESLALVHVHAVGNGQLTLDCFNISAELPPLASTPFAAPDTVLASFDLSSEQSRELRKAMRRFSQGIPSEVRDWLKRFVGAHDDAAIVFVDEHDTGVAWELVELDLNNEFLGERARTGRWTQVLYSQAAQLELSEPTHTGVTAAYLDRTQVPAPELSAVTELQPIATQSVVALGTLIAASTTSIGMAYIGVQGVVMSWSDPADAFECLPMRTVGTLELDWDTINGAAPLPLIVINANHSAHVVRAKNGAACGALRYVLGRVADAFLGPVGAIRDDDRAAVLSALLAQARTAERGWAPAERLRQIRGAAADAFRKDSTAANLMRLLQSCMYVYYGHPGLRLTLRADPPSAPGVHHDQ